MSVTDRLLRAIAIRLAVLVLMCLAARVFPTPVTAQAPGEVMRIAVASRH